MTVPAFFKKYRNRTKLLPSWSLLVLSQEQKETVLSGQRLELKMATPHENKGIIVKKARAHLKIARSRLEIRRMDIRALSLVVGNSIPGATRPASESGLRLRLILSAKSEEWKETRGETTRHALLFFSCTKNLIN